MTDYYEGPNISAELGTTLTDVSHERNPLSEGYAPEALEEIDGVSVDELADKHGSPLFVFSERTLRQKAHRMREAFLSRYPNTQFLWSFKTNWLDAVCSVFRSEGWIGEVVSGYEYSKARQLGYDGHEIVFNGPDKHADEIRKALVEGSLIQIDNWEELEWVNEIASDLGGVHDVGIRVWFATGHGPVWSKFGFSLTSGEARRAAMRIIDQPNLNLHTLHCHIGTYMLDPEAYRVAAQVMIGLRTAISDEFGHLVPCLNLGGGFPSYSLLHGMQGPAHLAVPPIEAYAQVIAEELNRLPPKERPQLRLESGRHLVDEAGYLIGSVVSVKGDNNAGMNNEFGRGAVGIKEQALPKQFGKTSYLLDVGINLLYTAAWFEVSVRPVRTTARRPEAVRLVGNLCMEIDVIRENVALPRMRSGERLVLWPVGAYNLGQSMQFIHLRPAVVMIDMKSKAHVIRRREEIKDTQALEKLPRHLQGTSDG